MLIRTAEPHRHLERLAAKREWRHRHVRPAPAVVTLVSTEIVTIEPVQITAYAGSGHRSWIAPVAVHKYGAARL